MKTYVITLSRYFPAKHSKAGEPTQFRDAFYEGMVFNRGSECTCLRPKLHTIRANYPLWEKRIKDVQDGKAFLSIRQWTGRPYWSKELGLREAEQLHKILKEMGIMFKQSGQWLLTAKYSEKGYTKPRTHQFTRNDGTIGTNTTTVWTEKGRAFLHTIR